ncbi:transporter substrate-binding domain-containing protein [Paracoccus thiocyanatus]|uniref:Amino acid ABC transporter n=1 Tax=Paracoccus thiocyanatus TaxID=34006 RepID=A0A3D8PHN8_9RHOB|nr:transporter substrate-binding domain-containing protein [Paracoccus thiocyanatus]RDW14739.1 amino acid ABC transporter [Paracoccus thiocyanatus]
MKLLKFLLPALVALAPALATAGTLDKIQSSKTLTIAFDPNVPPWSYKDQNLNYAGYEWMVASKFAADNGLTLKAVETNGANRIPLLMTGQVDVVWTAMSITDERKEVIDFSIPYAGTQTAVSGPPEVAIETPEDLAGKSIAVARGTIMDDQLTKVAPAGTNIVRFEDEATTLTSILSGQVPLVAQSTSLNYTIMKRDPSKVIEPKIILGTSLHGVGMRKGDEDLKALIDGWLLENMKSGELQRMFEEAHEMPMPEFVTEAVLGKTD